MPTVAKGVNNLAVTITPKLVCQRHGHLGPGRDRLIEQGVNVLDIDIEHHRATAKSLG